MMGVSGLSPFGEASHGRKREAGCRVMTQRPLAVITG